jgi:hypothetical protein
MARPKTKQELIEQSQVNFDKLWQVIDSMSTRALETEFDFDSDPKKKEAHWQRDKNLRDILIHLYEWHQLLLNWVNGNLCGKNTPFLPPPYNWITYGELNIQFWDKHQSTQLQQAKKMLKQSHAEAVDLVTTFTNDELFTKKFYDWTGTTTLGSYCVSALPSHYDWATKKLRAHIKQVS